MELYIGYNIQVSRTIYLLLEDHSCRLCAFWKPEASCDHTMKLGRLVPFTLIGGIAAQSNGTTLTDALNSQNASLSSLIALLSSAPSVVQTLSTVSNVTILAPDNNALAAFVNSSSNAPITPDNLAALLSYHVLNGTYYASNFTNTSAFIHTSLTNQTFANVTDGQVVEGVLKNGNVTIFSGLGENSTVTSAVRFPVLTLILTPAPGDSDQFAHKECQFHRRHDPYH